MKSGDARVALIGFPSVGKVAESLLYIHVICLLLLLFTSNFFIAQ